MMKYVLIAILFCSCVSQSEEAQEKTNTPPPIGIKHTLFNNSVTIYLPEKYERYNFKELAASMDAENGNEKINRLFDERFIRYFASVNKSGYVFIDTLTFEEIIEFEKLPARSPKVKREYSTEIASLLKTRVGQFFDLEETDLETEQATFTSEKTFNAVYVKIKSNNPNLVCYSNQFAISSKNKSNPYLVKSFLLDSYSLHESDLSFLKNQISIQ